MVINILETGAVSDGKTLNTTAIQKAIDCCAENGGGQVVIPAGVFLSGSIWLKSHVELHLAHGAVLKASENLDDYNPLDAYPQNYSYKPEGWLGKHLLIAVNQTDIALTGHGTLDGSAAAFMAPWKGEPWSSYIFPYGVYFSADEEKCRPGQLVAFVECDHIRITDVTFQNTPCWACFLHGCDYAWIRGIHVLNEKYTCNSDGLDIDTCRYVTVSDCIIDTGDDAIAVRCAAHRLQKKVDCCEHITITNCVLGSCSSVFRFGVGYGTIRNITVSNINIFRGGIGIHLMTAYLKSGKVNIENIQFRNIFANNVGFPFEIAEYNDCYIRDVTIDGYRAKGMCCSKIHGEEPGAISNITLRDIDIEPIEAPFPLLENADEERGDALLLIKDAGAICLDRVSLRIPVEQASKWNAKSRFTNSDRITVRDCDL